MSSLRFWAPALLAALLARPAAAQVAPATTDIPVNTQVTAGPDSAAVNTTVVPDSVRRTARLFGLKMTRPTKAGVLALLAPSAGQIYNKVWWKLPLVYGALGGTGYGLYYYQNLYKAYGEALDKRTDNDPLTVDDGRYTQNLRNTDVVSRLNTFRRQRDTFVAWVALAYSLQALDAVVDAHLRDFDISDDLSLRWDPTLLRASPTAAVPAPGVGLTLTLK